MAGTTTPKNYILQLIFGGNLHLKSDDAIEEDLEKLDERRDSSAGQRKPSAYVEVFQTMVRTVIDQEHWLLSEQEINTLEHLNKLCYNTRYCLTRLVLRKANQWHAVSALEKYKKEVGEDGLLSSITDLCRPINTLLKQEPEDPSIKAEHIDSVKLEPMDADIPIKKEEGPDIIDLTLDSDDEEDVKPNTQPLTAAAFDNYWSNKAGPSRIPLAAPQEDPVQAILNYNAEGMQLDFFCEDETKMTLQEILWRLTKDKLMELVRETKCKLKPNPKKKDIIYALRYTATTQSLLDFSKPLDRKGKGRARDDGLHQTKLSFLPAGSKSAKPKVTQEERLREMAIQRLGKCVRVNFNFYRLVRRLHIICYRETEHPTSLLLPALLSTFKKRNYTPYRHSRCNNIWSSREELVEYEKALELEKIIEELVEPPRDPNGKRATKTPAPKKDQIVTLVTPGPGRAYTTPLRTPGSVTNLPSETRGLKKEEEVSLCEEVASEEQEPVEIKREEMVKRHFDGWIFPKWRECVTAQPGEGANTRPPGLERFDAGYVFTRVMYRATSVLGPAKEYELELKIIESLLSQRIWCRGKRAVWYTRRAVILGHLVRGASNRDARKELLHKTRRGLIAALLDQDTGIVWRPSLVRRLFALEKTLNTPPHEQTKSDGVLLKAPIVELLAERVHPLQLDALGRPISGKENTPEAGLHAYISVTKKEYKDGKDPEEPKPVKRKPGKSSWKGRNDQILNVETRALEFYEDQGYKGFHSETRILTTIFGLLFWDIIFADVPGAFDTPYQYAPLDICSDSFYRARQDLIDTRLAEIRDNRGREILEKHDDMYREKQIICAGVRWDLCSKEDLLDIVRCLGGEALAFICQLFCEDYKGRSSGVPDLFIWNAEKGKCKFVEVKGPGDSPQENQKFWFDSLLRAKADSVEICKVVDINDPKRTAGSKKRKAKTPSSARRKSAAQEEGREEEEDYDLLDPEPEGDVDFNLEGMPPNKRRRIADPESQHPNAMDVVPLTDLQHSPSSRPRLNEAEVVLTPSKLKCKKF